MDDLAPSPNQWTFSSAFIALTILLCIVVRTIGVIFQCAFLNRFRGKTFSMVRFLRSICVQCLDPVIDNNDKSFTGWSVHPLLRWSPRSYRIRSCFIHFFICSSQGHVLDCDHCRYFLHSVLTGISLISVKFVGWSWEKYDGKHSGLDDSSTR